VAAELDREDAAQARQGSWGEFFWVRIWPSLYKPQLKNGWKSTEADEMGQWKAFWNLLGFTQGVKAKVDFGGNAAADVSG
jgi:hypothetical protein